MKQASIPVYIRFGEIPKNERSKVHYGDDIAGQELGVSVWEAIKANGCYYPKLPDDANENAISDYFHQLFEKNKKVYLVIGEKWGEGQCREPVLRNVKIIKEIANYSEWG